MNQKPVWRWSPGRAGRARPRGRPRGLAGRSQQLGQGSAGGEGAWAGSTSRWGSAVRRTMMCLQASRSLWGELALALGNVFPSEESKRKLAADWRERAKLFLRRGVSADADTETSEPKRHESSQITCLGSLFGLLV